jgi:hypothetical protein
MKFYWMVAILPALIPGAAISQVQAVRAYDVYDSVGVNTHWYYGNGYQYLPQFSQLVQIMSQDHLRHFRDGVYAQGTNTPQYLSQMYSTLASGGIHADLIVPAGESATQIEAGLAMYPGVEAIEPPNEWDINGGSNWAWTLQQEEPAIYQAGKDLGLTVLGPALVQPGSYSQVGDLSEYMDFNNMHPYFGGRNPETGGWGGPDQNQNYYGSLAYDADFASIDGPNRASYATETGYITTSTPRQNQIPESVEGIYAPRVVLDFFNKGFKRTYFYELIDDPSWAQPGYGLLRYDLSPKPAAIALTNLLSILEDSNTSFTPESLNYSLSGDTSGVESLLVEKSEGQFWLAVWLDGSIYDVNALQATPVPSRQLTLSIPGGRVATYLDSFGSDGNMQGTPLNQSNLQFPVSIGLTMIRIAYPGH